MIKMRQNKKYFINLVQLLIIIVFFIIGINFKAEGSTISSTILSMLTKVQTSTPLQNFIWLLTHNLTVMFLVFWLSYFSFGVIGTLWCISDSFMIGMLAKSYVAIINNSWLSILFMVLELIAAILVTLSSTYFKLERHNFKKAFRNKIDFDEIYKIEKKKHEKNILYVFAAVAIVLLIAAIIETIVPSSL